MKKSIALVFGVLFLFASAQAAILVTQDGKTTKYPSKKNTVITVNGTTDTTIEYNGVKFFVPKGVKMTLAQENGNVIVRGNDLTGVQVGDMTLSAQGPTVFSVAPSTQVVSVRQGTVTVTAKDGSTTSVDRGSAFAASAKTSQAAKATMATTQDVPTFVAADEVSDTASQQASQNAEEEVLSPSAPR